MRILKITSPDICNGLGNRVTVWVAGCSHHCPHCQNPHTWDYNIGTDISIKENYDKVYSVICEQLDRNIIKGVTFSGGDPLNQSDKNLNILYNLISNIKDKYENKDIWIYSGDIYENDMLNETKSKILSKCDVLVDGPFIFEKRDLKLPFKGSSNQRVIDLKHSTPNNVSILL